MINVQIEGILDSKYNQFIDNCINTLFPVDAAYDITLVVDKFVGEPNEHHAGLCTGDDVESVIDIATHWICEGEEIAFFPQEIAEAIAHELTHAKQFYRKQINMDNDVWTNSTTTIDCSLLDYAETPWEVEAYGYEDILTDLFWEE
tara:strand:- start:696 stop:1133 length:438 start_codon:yes stop_codon:yes gene_type:complete